MARKYSLDDHPDFQRVKSDLWREAQNREHEGGKDSLSKGWSEEEWLSYVYHLILQELSIKNLDVSTLEADELEKIIIKFKYITKHLMTPPYLRKYFNQNVSA